MIITDEIKNRVTNLYTNIITLKMEIENKNKELEVLRNKLKNGGIIYPDSVTETYSKTEENNPSIHPTQQLNLLVNTFDENNPETLKTESPTDSSIHISELTQKVEMKETELNRAKKEIEQLKQELKRTKQELEKAKNELENEINNCKAKDTFVEKPKSEIIVEPVVSDNITKEFQKVKDELYEEHMKNSKLRSENIRIINENTQLKLALKEAGKK